MGCGSSSQANNVVGALTHAQQPSTKKRGSKKFDKQAELDQALNQVEKEERNISYLSKITNFDIPTLRKLHQMFMRISASHEDDEMIDEAEFADAVGMQPGSLLVKRLFSTFNVTTSGSMNFREFALALSMLSDTSEKEDRDKKIKFSFNLYDIDRNGEIDKSELRKLLVSALEESNVHLSERNIDLIVENTLKTTDSDSNGVIDFQEYEELVNQNPRLLYPFTIDIEELIESNRHTHIDSHTGSHRQLHHGAMKTTSRRGSRKGVGASSRNIVSAVRRGVSAPFLASASKSQGVERIEDPKDLWPNVE